MTGCTAYSEPASVNLYLVSELPLAVISIGWPLRIAGPRASCAMIPVSLGEIAAVVGGTVESDGATTQADCNQKTLATATAITDTAGGFPES